MPPHLSLFSISYSSRRRLPGWRAEKSPGAGSLRGRRKTKTTGIRRNCLGPLLLWRPAERCGAQRVYNNCVSRRIKPGCPLGSVWPLGTMAKHCFAQIALVSLGVAAIAAAQSVVPDSPPAIGPAKSTLFDRVISNQRKNEEAADVYERIERLETRKSPG